MDSQGPVTMLVTYYPKPGCENELLPLVKQHWPVLSEAGLATSEPAKIWKAKDKRTGATYFVEKFQWATPDSAAIAHQTPEVMAVWEPMGPVLENLVLTQIEEV